jgi:D-alanyl-D-alanine carboxypeptidase (penicillin-binding protein 5/6)
LIARAKKDGKDCLIVMMNAKENRWKMAEDIFEQVFVPKSLKNRQLNI